MVRVVTVDFKRAEGDIRLVLAYLDHFCYLDKGAKENLEAFLAIHKRSVKNEPFTLNPGETHVWGPFTMRNMGLKKFLVRLDVTEVR